MLAAGLGDFCCFKDLATERLPVAHFGLVLGGLHWRL